MHDAFKFFCQGEIKKVLRLQSGPRSTEMEVRSRFFTSLDGHLTLIGISAGIRSSELGQEVAGTLMGNREVALSPGTLGPTTAPRVVISTHFSPARPSTCGSTYREL
jgi:hypothetical protein